MLHDQPSPSAVAFLYCVRRRDDVGYRIAPVIQDFDFRIATASRAGFSLGHPSARSGPAAFLLLAGDFLSQRRPHDRKSADGGDGQWVASSHPQRQELPREELAYPARELH